LRLGPLEGSGEALLSEVEVAALVVGFVAVVVKLGILGLLLAVFETRVAKLRLFRVPELLALSFTLALLAAASSFFTK